MSKLIFFDTETTGNETRDFLIQIAYKTGSEKFVGLYKPEIKIPPEASAVHHITNKMVTDKPSFAESGDLEKIKALFEDEISKKKIEELDLSTRTKNALSNVGIKNVGLLSRKTEKKLREVEGLGDKGIQEIKRELGNLGLTLKS